MPAKSVTQYTCDRCTRVWYLDPKEAAPKVKLNLLLERGRTPDSPDGEAIRYECLCSGCEETVTKLVQSLAPLKPRERKAKKEGGSDDPPPSTTTAAPGAQAKAAASPPSGPASSAAESTGAKPVGAAAAVRRPT